MADFASNFNESQTVPERINPLRTYSVCLKLRKNAHFLYMFVHINSV